MSRFAGGQLTGRFSWPAGLVDAARRYTREMTTENLKSLENARMKAAREIAELQSGLGLSFVTDGGVGFLDAFTPYAGGAEGAGSSGNIDKYPGTRNSYFHTPVVQRALRGGSAIGEHGYAGQIGKGRRKAILPSPAALALASENSYYSDLEDLLMAYARVLKSDVGRLASEGYEMIQLDEGFLLHSGYSKLVRKRLISTFLDAIELIFHGFRKRSLVYLHSGDASLILPRIAKAPVTDVGFDFNTPPGATLARIDKNVVLGLQNTTRKLPEEWLAKEPATLVSRVFDYSKRLRLDKNREVFLSPSQDYDGLQTYSQAKARLENLAKATTAIGGRWE